MTRQILLEVSDRFDMHHAANLLLVPGITKFQFVDERATAHLGPILGEATEAERRQLLPGPHPKTRKRTEEQLIKKRAYQAEWRRKKGMKKRREAPNVKVPSEYPSEVWRRVWDKMISFDGQFESKHVVPEHGSRSTMYLITVEMRRRGWLEREQVRLRDGKGGLTTRYFIPPEHRRPYDAVFGPEQPATTESNNAGSGKGSVSKGGI